MLGTRTVRCRGRDRKSTRLNSQSRQYLVCRLLLEKKKPIRARDDPHIRQFHMTPPVEETVKYRWRRLGASNGACVVCGQCLDVFFFNDTSTTEIYTLSLHDALPI